MKDKEPPKEYTTAYWLGIKSWTNKNEMMHDHIYDSEMPPEAYRAEILGDREPIGKTIQYCIRNEWDEYSTWLATRKL